MGAFLGLLLGLGIVLIVWTFTRPSEPEVRPGQRSASDRLNDLLAEAGIESVTATQLIVTCVGCGVFVFGFLVLVTQGVVTVPAFFAAGAAYLPLALVRMRARSRRQELRDLWPDVVDNLASSVRAGMSLAEGLTAIGHRGPEALRRPFQRFAEDYRATGRFNDCLDQLKQRLADPVGDRIVESLRVAREVGGSDLGRLLRTLSQFLREDARTRAELQARQSFTVNGARVAVAAPWVVLGLMCLQPDVIEKYNEPGGFVVLVIGAAVSVVAYRVMMRIGRLPEEQRVLR
ncbi:MAG TPA: type II secretion system F family protein [Actinopolymorphaceae bacterium]